MVDDQMYRVRVSSSGWGGAPGLNTFYFKVDDAMQENHATAALDVVTRVHTALSTASGIFPTPWSCQVNPVVDVLDADNGEILESWVVATPAGVNGTGIASFGPQVAMICATLLTGDILDGRRIRGRAFFGPLAAVDDADGTPNAQFLQTVSDQLIILMGGATVHVPYVVWSRRRGISLTHPTGLGGSAHVVSGILVKDTYAVLRSRRQ